MLITSNGRAAHQESQQCNQNNEELKVLFNAIDQIKTDLGSCGKGITENDLKCFGSGDHYFYSKWRNEDKLVQAGYWYDDEMNLLLRRVNNQKPEIVLWNITDFYINYFESSQSILYRLELNHKQQVRGYIFLSNLIKKGEKTNESEN